MENFEKLPKFLMHFLFSFIEYKDVVRMERVSKSMKAQILNKLVWKKMCEKYHLKTEKEQADWKQYFKENYLTFSITHSWFDKSFVKLEKSNRRIEYKKSNSHVVYPINQNLKEVNRLDLKIVKYEIGLWIGLFNIKTGNKFGWLGGGDGTVGWGKF